MSLKCFNYRRVYRRVLPSRIELAHFVSITFFPSLAVDYPIERFLFETHQEGRGWATSCFVETKCSYWPVIVSAASIFSLAIFHDGVQSSSLDRCWIKCCLAWECENRKLSNAICEMAMMNLNKSSDQISWKRDIWKINRVPFILILIPHADYSWHEMWRECERDQPSSEVFHASKSLKILLFENKMFH